MDDELERWAVADNETIVSGMAGRYASALFALAKEQHITDEVAGDLNGFIALTRDSADLARLVRSPVFSADEQVTALGQVLDKAGVSALTANFLKLVASKRRLFAIESMTRDYNALNDADKGVVRARVTVAEPISQQQWADLERALSGMSAGKSVAMDVFIDRSLIGGLIVKLGSQMIDGSVRTKLNAIRTRMKEVG